MLWDFFLGQVRTSCTARDCQGCSGCLVHFQSAFTSPGGQRMPVPMQKDSEAWLHSTHNPLLITHHGDTKVTRTWSLLPEEETIKSGSFGSSHYFWFKKKKKKENQKNLFILCFLYKKNEHNKLLTSDFQRQQSSSMAVKMTLLCPGIGPVLQSSDDSNLLQWPGIKD